MTPLKVMTITNFKCLTAFLGFILFPTLSSSQNQNGQNFDHNNPGFIPLIVNNQPLNQNRLSSTAQFQQNQRFQQQPVINQQLKQEPQNNQKFQPESQLPQQDQNIQDAQGSSNSDNKSLSESCLACICQASTNCKLSTPCANNQDRKYCGPFLLSKPFWIDAGRPTLIDDSPDREGAFEDCALDPICSAQTVRKYMNKFQKDCNGDGKIDCEDLTRIHLMGPLDCSNEIVATTVFYRKFKQCWNRVLQLSE